MNRREFVRTGIATAVAAKVEAQTPRRKMNVLYLFSDQHREASLPGRPFSPVESPVLEKFRRENFALENCISNYPLCTPHRGILMSGRWPQQSGISGNGHKLGPDENALGHTFRNAGYNTGYVGKWHLDGDENHFIPPGPLRAGFDDWHAWADTNAHYASWTYDSQTGAKIQPSGWNGTLMTDDALTFMKKQTADKPWFLVVSWNPPHPPYDPPPVDAQVYPQPGLQFRPNVRMNGPGSAQQYPQLSSPEKLKHAEQGYYGAITGIDKEVGRILALLEEMGQADNTIVVYTSDHGEMMGSHARMQKIVPFEESCHVPFFARVPGQTGKGTSSKDLFSSIDIYPTLCGLAGIAVPKHCAGRDMSALITGSRITASQGVFLMANSGGASLAENDVPTYRGIRTAQYTYAVMEDGRWILYDNVADPYQMKNLVADAAHKALMDKFDVQISAWQKGVGDKFDIEKAAERDSAYPT